MKVFALRLKPGADLKLEIARFAKEKNIYAGFVITCVGSLKKASLRMANIKTIANFSGPFEIVSLAGTIAQNGLHLHAALSDGDGKLIGGHVKEGCIIFTTAEIVIGEGENLLFSRAFDQETNFKELNVQAKQQ